VLFWPVEPVTLHILVTQVTQTALITILKVPKLNYFFQLCK